MRRYGMWTAFGLAAVAFLVGGWMSRAALRDAWEGWNRPSVPLAVAYRPPIVEEQGNASTTTPVENIIDKVIEAVAPADPLAWKDALPSQINLAIPFLLQAPTQDWSDPFEDACEEASLIMTDAFYDGRKTNYGAEEGTKVILDLVAWEDATYGHNKDTTTPEVAQTAREYFGYKDVLIRPLTGPEDLKRVLANGYPVIVPAYGKALFNPNFRNGGPAYHMLVVKGYTKDGKWITNDPGTRRGADYIYTNDVLMNAIHSFDSIDMQQGAKEFIVVLPRS